MQNPGQSNSRSDMGGAYYIGVIVDKQNPGRHSGFSASVVTNDEGNASCQKLSPGIMCR
jgi:hypothetical protein